MPHELVYKQMLSLPNGVLLGMCPRKDITTTEQQQIMLDNIRVAVDKIRAAHIKEADRWAKSMRNAHRHFKVGEEVLIWRTAPKTDKEKGTHKKLILIGIKIMWLLKKLK